MSVMTRFQARKEERQISLPSSHGEIARVAYELFERRGRVHGRDQQDWFEAERIVQQRRRGGNGR